MGAAGLELHPAPWIPSARVPRRAARLPRAGSKGLKGPQVQFQKNQTKGKGVGRPLVVPAAAFASRRAPLLGAARPRLPVPSPLCGPTSPNLGHTYDQPVAAGNARTGRTAALSGPASAQSRMRSIDGEGPISKNKEKEKGRPGFKFPPAPGGCFSPDYPFCSLRNESIQGELPAAALKNGLF
jgi:hypothetical protein